MSDVLWEINGVQLAGVPHPRLADVSLSIHRGVTAVLGYSGAGKTSLLNLLVGFEKPDRGVIQACFATGDGRLPLYWVPHNDGLWPHLTARQHLEAAGGGAGLPTEMLAAFDLADKAGSYPDQLSQGERSRLAVARALMTEARVLVMDEPLVHVDPARVGRYWDVIRGALARSGASLVFSTHSPKAVLAEAERAVCLDLGRVLYEGRVDRLYHDPPNEALARCMGEANWLSPEEVRVWIGEESAKNAKTQAAPGSEEKTHGPCYRPEELEVVADADSPLMVRATRFQGAVTEVDLYHEGDQRERRFVCRSTPGTSHTAGARVALRVCMTVLLAAVLTACGRSASGPTFSVREEHHWNVPSDGLKVPSPRRMTIGDHGEVLVLDTDARVLVYGPDGELARQWRMPDGKNGNPEGVLLLKDGRIAVSDTHYNRVVIFDHEGKVLTMFGTFGKGPGEFIYPVTLTQDASENLYVCEYGGNDRVQKFDRQGKFILSFGAPGTDPGQFQRPSGLVWLDGKVYVADAVNGRVQVFQDDGKFEGILGQGQPPLGLQFPYDLCIAPGNPAPGSGSEGTKGQATLYIIEWGGDCLTHVTLDGRLLGRYGTAGTGDAQFRTPWGLALDPGRHLVVADTGNKRIVELKL